jgi:ATP-binding cassette, subfamily F, member 3
VKKAALEAVTPEPNRKATAAARQERSQTLKPLQKESAQIEQRLNDLKREKVTLEASLSRADIKPQALADAGRQLKTLTQEAQDLEARWLELSVLIDEVA